MEYLVETRDLVKKYRNQKVINHVNMHIPRGSIYGFIGRNGAGKRLL